MDAKAAGYYRDKLAADRLRACYDLASPRIRRYLDAELDFVLGFLRPGDRVLDLGCGYGRTLGALAGRAGPSGMVLGIDSSLASLRMAAERLGPRPDLLCAAMDAAALGLASGFFDRVIAVQNGVSAFHVEPRLLFDEALRVLRPGGLALFSSYSPKFWTHRLDWFRRQAAAGLLGEIDEEMTGNGVIVGRDGFRAVTWDRDRFLAAAGGRGAEVRFEEVDESSLFCVLSKASPAAP